MDATKIKFIPGPNGHTIGFLEFMKMRYEFPRCFSCGEDIGSKRCYPIRSRAKL